MSCSTSYKCLRCYLINARSLLNKLPELRHYLCVIKPDVLLITETWLHHSISSGLLDPDSEYYVLRRDRGHNRGGGVCAFVSRAFNVAQIDIDNLFNNIELLSFDLFSERSRLRFFVVYRPPHHHSDDMKLLTECLYRYTSKSHANVVTGDFNCPGINWSTLYTQNDGVHNVFLDCVVSAGFSPRVDFYRAAWNAVTA